MSVYYCCPSKRSIEQVQPVVDAWLERGYRVCLQRDHGDELQMPIPQIARPYSGYAEAQNHIIRNIIESDPQAEWFVCAGDDTFPDPHKRADEIAQECTRHFGGTFGVMQPTGDRWGEHADAHDFVGNGGACKRCGRARDCDQHLHGAYIDRVAGSPWIGREFARRVNGGNGPLWPEYFHMYEDEELMHVAKRLGVFWQRPDLTHHHEHWARKRGAGEQDMPKFLTKANSGENWRASRELFERRLREGFPGSEVIA